MRQNVSRLSLLCILLCMPFLAAWSIGSIASREKKETFSFKNIKENSLLILSKDFGNITITQWDKDEIFMERKQTVSASTGDRAQKKLESRVVKPKKNGDTYTFELTFKDGNLPNDNYNFDDVWTLYVPKNKCSYDVENKFGDVIFLNNFKCNSLKAKVNFGKLSIQEADAKDRCKIEVTHGGLNINRINQATVSTKFTDIEIGRAGELTFNVAFGNAKIKHLDSGTGEASFSNLSISSLRKNLELSKCSHGNADVTLSDAQAFENLSINSNFGNINLYLSDKIEARYNIESKHGNIKMKSTVHTMFKQDGEADEKFVQINRGYFRKNSATHANIYISAKYGNVTVKDR